MMNEKNTSGANLWKYFFLEVQSGGRYVIDDSMNPKHTSMEG